MSRRRLTVFTRLPCVTRDGIRYTSAPICVPVIATLGCTGCTAGTVAPRGTTARMDAYDKSRFLPLGPHNSVQSDPIQPVTVVADAPHLAEYFHRVAAGSEVRSGPIGVRTGSQCTRVVHTSAQVNQDGLGCTAPNPVQVQYITSTISTCSTKAVQSSTRGVPRESPHPLSAHDARRHMDAPVNRRSNCCTAVRYMYWDVLQYCTATVPPGTGPKGPKLPQNAKLNPNAFGLWVSNLGFTLKPLP